MEQQLDVLAIGDVVTDAFIKLLDDQAWLEERDGKKVLTMPYATKIPFQEALVVEGVGNAANASVSFAKLGLRSGLIGNVGADSWGRDIIAALGKKYVDTRFVHVNPGKVSNYHYVLWYHDDRTILIKHEEYDYHWPRFRSVDIPRWVYFSSISENALDYHDDVADWLDRFKDVKLAFQPGTFQMKAGAERLKRIYNHTEVLVLNREEAVLVGGGNYDDFNNLFDTLHQLGPKIVCITDGPRGSYVSDGSRRFKMPNYPDPGPPVERTGAGDSYASTFVAALMHGESVEEAMRWGPINSMNVVQHVGAQEGLLSRDELKQLLADAPDWYYPEQI